MRWLFPLFLRGSLRSLTRSIFFLRVKVRPFDLADFVLTHRGRNGKADDPPNGNLLKAICFESSDQTIEFILCRPSVALIPLPNETEPCQRNARQTDGLD